MPLPRVHVFYHNKPWRPPKNRYDSRVCPDCQGTVHGDTAQFNHREWHLHINALMQEFAKRTGLAEEEVPDHTRWTAAVGEELGEHESIEGG